MTLFVNEQAHTGGDMRLLGIALLCAFSTSAKAADCFVTANKADANNITACFTHPNLKWAYPAPMLSSQELTSGPATGHLMGPNDEVYCAFRPHPAAATSPKFRCFRTTARNFRTGFPEYLNNQGRVVPTALYVGYEGTPDDGYLLDRIGRRIPRPDGGFEKGDELKIKYFEGGANHGAHFEGARAISNSRQSEGFTETAASRIFWALGLPADSMYNVGRVHCFGCTGDPFHQKQFAANSTATFYDASVEIKYEGKKIADQWSWEAVTKNHFAPWPSRTRVEFEQLVLAAQLIAYHNFLGFQNRLSCAEGALDSSTKRCSEPVALINDIGSTFGGKRSGVLSQNPRGSLRDYVKNSSKNAGKVFVDGRCELRYPASLFSKATPEGVREFQRRLSGLTRENVRAIFHAAKFGRMEPDLLRHYGREDVVVEIWTNEFMARANDILRSTCVQ